MRRCGRDPQFVVENGIFYGLNLPADFTAEHEWGTERLKKEFGIPSELEPTEGPFGVARRRSTKCPPQEDVLAEYGENQTIMAAIHKSKTYVKDRKKFFYEEEDDLAALTIGYSIYDYNKNISLPLLANLPRELKLYSDADIAGAWDGESFGVLVQGEKNIGYLRLLKKAIEDCNILLLRTGIPGLVGAFENAGLTIILSDKYPQEAADEMEKDDLDRCKLYKTSDEIKVKLDEKLKEAGLRYFALSPRWKGSQKTQYKVTYWLNPYDQENNNYGQFTVEDLEQWIKGKGPIPKTAEEKKKRY